MRPARACAAWLLYSLLLAAASCSRTRGADPSATAFDAGPLPCIRCSDGLFCNGEELCAVAGGCLPGKPPTCDDQDECTVDRCDASHDRCVQQRRPRDVDRDGFDACEGDCNDEQAEIHPGADERCDDVDSDCDGKTDEGLRSACNDCRPGCRLLFVPPLGEPWSLQADNSDGVVADAAGGPLTLSSTSRQRFDAWIANFVDGKVTKLDTRNGQQLARYDSVLLDKRNNAQPPDEACDSNGQVDGGNCPSRTAVDREGAVYVANRAFGGQGTITKIAGFEDDCVDRNGDGKIATSRDKNGNGQIDSYIDGEFLGQDDECLLWTVDVGGRGGVPRALAIAPDGSVWVGLHGESRVLKLDPQDGKQLADVVVAGFRPYGAAIDSAGRLWMTEALSGQILQIDTESSRVGIAISAPSPERGCPSSYGIAVDSEGRVWIAGFTCPYAFGYDPDLQQWTSVPLPDSGVTRGIAADDQGRIYVASSHEWIRIDPTSTFGFFEASDPITRLTVFDAVDGGSLMIFGTRDAPLPGAGAIGVGLDAESHAWLINQDSGSATSVDAKSGDAKHFNVGDMPYTYSDFTGFALRRITAPSGFVTAVLEGCNAGPSEWERVTIDAEIPVGTVVEVRLRSANSRVDLGAARWSDSLDGSSIDLLTQSIDLRGYRFLEVEARLVSDDRSHSPSLDRITVQLNCPG